MDMDKPRIRFKGYIDAWEQRKVSEFTFPAGEKNKNDLQLEAYAITNEHGFIPQNEAHDDFGYMKNTDRAAYNIVRSNSFAYNPARINVGSIGYYEGQENVIISSLYEVFQTKEYVDDRFLWQWFKADEFPGWIERLQEGSVRQYFYYDKLCECQLMMPGVEEQRRIATYFSSLDHLITLHQRKSNEAKTLKKYMLQNMFPQNGSNVPKIRFDGFTDAWEQRKVSDEVDSIDTGKSTFEAKESGDYEILGSTGVIGYDDSFDYEGDFLLTARVGANAGTLYRHSGKVKITDNTVFFQGDHIDFVFYLLDKFDLRKLSFGSGQPLIKASELKNFELLMPTNGKEKEKIAEYFSKLDHLITLRQRKLEMLKKVKKTMLEKMFVQGRCGYE